MRVALFVTCLSDTLYPDVAQATVRVLSRFGCEVVFPEAQICCGQPMYNSGYHGDAKRAAKALVEALEGTDAIVSPSGSCTTMVRNEWAHLFAGDREWGPRAHAIAKRSYEICEFLVDRLGVDALEQPLGRFAAKATVHRSCHMGRLLGVKDQPLRLLRRIGGLELVELPFAEDCCGFGGTFAVKMADVSTAMADEKCDHVAETGADLLIGADMACLMHLGGRLRRRGARTEVLHVMQVLDRAMAAGEVPA